MYTKEIIQIENISFEKLKKELLTELKLLIRDLQLEQNKEEELLSRQETAKLLKVSLVTLWDWTKKDIVPAYRIGYKVRYKKREVLSALKPKNRF